LLNICKWGLGIGDWGLGIGDWGFGPIPQNPNPKPQKYFLILKLKKNLKYKKNLILN